MMNHKNGVTAYKTGNEYFLDLYIEGNRTEHKRITEEHYNLIVEDAKKLKSVKQEERETSEDLVNSPAQLHMLGFEHSPKSTANWTEYFKDINGVRWSFIQPIVGEDYFMKDGELMCYCANWAEVNTALDKYNLRD